MLLWTGVNLAPFKSVMKHKVFSSRYHATELGTTQGKKKEDTENYFIHMMTFIA